MSLERDIRVGISAVTGEDDSSSTSGTLFPIDEWLPTNVSRIPDFRPIMSYNPSRIADTQLHIRFSTSSNGS